MTFYAQSPRISELLSLAVEGLVRDLPEERKVRRRHHAVEGRYGDILRGWAGQAELVRKRLMSEVVALRLSDQNSGPSLRELAESEYFATIADQPRKAVGNAILLRTKFTTSSSQTGNFVPGVVPAGTKFTRGAALEAAVPIQYAEFVSTEPVVCGRDDAGIPPVVTSGGFTHYQFVSVPITASSDGAHANTPQVQGFVQPELSIGSDLFDKAALEHERFVLQSLSSSGGTAGVVDEQIRKLCRALARGFDGPTNSAAVAGSLSDPGIRYVLPHLDYSRGILRLFAADESWAISQRHQALLRQELENYPWIGFGCRVGFGGILNVPITLRASVILRSRKDEIETSQITNAIRATAQRYFDDRPDFHVWRRSMLGGAISVADRRVLTCTDVEVLDQDGVSLTEPSSAIDAGQPVINHYQLARGGVEVNYEVAA